MKEIALGEWMVVLGEIVETHVDKDMISNAHKSEIDRAKINPLL
jgi:hypothetical protein